MTACLLSAALLALAQADKALPPLTDAQHEQLQELVRTTQKQAADLRAELEKRQRELARRYAAFDLDGPAVEKTQADVVDLQRRLLANYHRLQVELRRIVGRARFATLRQRLDRILGVPPSREK
ncbi:MAG: hypothetical protein IT429_16530 [Gemmataceae bacterium]|nr:hypothetical protein [Gemmataceae bacterium]